MKKATIKFQQPDTLHVTQKIRQDMNSLMPHATTSDQVGIAVVAELLRMNANIELVTKAICAALDIELTIEKVEATDQAALDSEQSRKALLADKERIEKMQRQSIDASSQNINEQALSLIIEALPIETVQAHPELLTKPKSYILQNLNEYPEINKQKLENFKERLRNEQ